MRWRGALAVCSLAGCGRIGFDPASDASSGDGARLTYRAAVLEDAPLGYWRLDDPAATARDELGRFDGVYLGACAHGVPGALTGDLDTAVRLDGASCAIELPDGLAFPDRAPFTVELWVLLDAIDTYQHFVMKERRDTTNPIDGYALLESPSGVYFERAVNQNLVTTQNVEVPAAKFVYVAGTFDGGALRLQLDDVTTPLVADPGFMRAYSAPAMIGVSNAGIGYVGGVIDELAIYDHALPQARVDLHRRLGVEGPR